MNVRMFKNRQSSRNTANRSGLAHFHWYVLVGVSHSQADSHARSRRSFPLFGIDLIGRQSILRACHSLLHRTSKSTKVLSNRFHHAFQAAYPPNHYIRQVPQRKIHLFTFLQLIQLFILCLLGFSPILYAKLILPIWLVVMVAFRYRILPKIIASKYLRALDQRL
jgi:hypothetical protein